ncbi:hypothetical protein BCR37DRAFT_344939 [Protomyces lactucae-debilis]|uniref:RRM domain-containing protein n=1 Tax=Protomyces lactucae-debilis TaxID=2754530 RepID=A0A1Y2FLF0_PROLT|nr:uncharacterized protein BCR37DRAFT_344939 [Protomyces lactucae-debilis]ORY84793.1 hypothetical protein BCR37DRAFT_344939 [Protomyces lactucae-debilis]
MYKVTAEDISLDVTKEQVKQFFAFCGRIEDIEITKGANHQTAIVTFERASAAKTALLLQHAQLGLNQIKVSTDDHNLDDRDLAAHEEGSDVPQEHKPRTAILAEVLSHGYVLGDTAIQKSIDFDKQNGISATFKTYLSSLQEKASQLDSQFKVTDKAKQVDDKFGITDKTKSQATGIQATLQRYFDSLTQHPVAAKVLSFYSEGVSSAQDIHNEARRLANLRQGNEEGSGVAAKAGEVIHESREKAADAAAAHVPEEKVPKLGSTA